MLKNAIPKNNKNDVQLHPKKMYGLKDKVVFYDENVFGLTDEHPKDVLLLKDRR